MIGNPETAFNRFASITMGFKEALLEEKEKKKDERKCDNFNCHESIGSAGQNVNSSYLFFFFAVGKSLAYECWQIY